MGDDVLGSVEEDWTWSSVTLRIDKPPRMWSRNRNQIQIRCTHHTIQRWLQEYLVCGLPKIIMSYLQHPIPKADILYRAEKWSVGEPLFATSIISRNFIQLESIHGQQYFQRKKHPPSTDACHNIIDMFRKLDTQQLPFHLAKMRSLEEVVRQVMERLGIKHNNFLKFMASRSGAMILQTHRTLFFRYMPNIIQACSCCDLTIAYNLCTCELIARPYRCLCLDPSHKDTMPPISLGVRCAADTVS
jgi:hypothetical protein